MTAKTLEEEAREIKRWSVTGSWENNGLCLCEEDSLGGWVTFSDHLAAATARDKEIEELRQKLADAEAKTAKWVLDDDAEEEKRLELLGFLHTAQYETVGGYGYWLMVPPVHIPEREAKLEQ